MQWRILPGVGTGRSPQAQPRNQERVGPARWTGAGFPATAPAILKVPGAPLQLRSGDVPREAGSGSPVASCLDKHASTVLVDCHLRGPSGTLTLAHCSSSCRQLSTSSSRLLPPRPQQSLTTLDTLSRPWGSALPPWCAPQSWGAQQALSYLWDILSSRNQSSILWKSHLIDKDF